MFEGFDGGSSGEEGENEGRGMRKKKGIPHLGPPVELYATQARRRALDLEEEGLEGFANSPAGEGDSLDAEAVEGKGVGKGEEAEGSGSGSEDDEGVVMGMRGEKDKEKERAKGDSQRFWE